MSTLMLIAAWAGLPLGGATVLYRLLARTERDYTARVAPPPAPPVVVAAPPQPPRRGWW